AGRGDRALRRALQPPPAARGGAERHAGGRVRGTAGDDLAPPCADQTRDAGAAQAGESERGMRKATCWEGDLLTSPNGPEDSDDVHATGGGGDRAKGSLHRSVAVGAGSRAPQAAAARTRTSPSVATRRAHGSLRQPKTSAPSPRPAKSPT